MKKRIPSEQEIAKKHGVSVDYVVRQAEIGSTVEREHVTTHEEAYGIALQHIAEFPDYYKHLLGMEKKLKKEWDKKQPVKEEHIPVKELESGLKVLKNTSYDSIDTLMRQIMKKHDMTAKELHNAFVDKHGKTPDDWIKKVKTFKEFREYVNQNYIEEGAAWTRKSGQNKNGGLNEKGRKSYERENPGSDLKAPSKKVGNPRRASFCARMKGMKAKLTSKKTASDPNSRINKSLRAWNC